ncbi:MAG TPA: GNAT family N-acetyltransferase [Stellaceae bacterium]|nr:GNAT family N-acetyltransferase [Stellaceae bacterium]
MTSLALDVIFQEEPDLPVREFADLLQRSGLAERRPMQDPDRLRRMLAHADILLCARDEEDRLIGLCRALTDFAFCCYVADLAVDRDWQRRGIGRELIRRAHLRSGPETSLLLLAAPHVTGYYPHIGMAKAENAFVTPRLR